MAKLVMITEAYELTSEMAEINKIDTTRTYVYDARLDMVMPRANIANNISKLVRNYVTSFCELTNRNPSCRPGYMTACGFLPVGLEPTLLTGRLINSVIVEGLQELGVEFYYHKPMSPLNNGFEIANDSATHDVWVNKMDAAKIVNKPIHNITALDVLEVLIV